MTYRGSKRLLPLGLVVLGLVLVAGAWLLILDTSGARDDESSQPPAASERKAADAAESPFGRSANDAASPETTGPPVVETDETATADEEPGEVATAPTHANAGIRGRVLDGSGEPVHGAVVVLVPRGRVSPVDEPGEDRVRTERDGTFEFRGLRAGDDRFYTLSVEPEGDSDLLVVSRTVQNLAFGEMRNAGVLRLLREATLEGVVLDPDEAPVAEAHVAVTWGSPGAGAHPRVRSVRTGEDGTFRAERLHPRTVYVQAQADGYRHSEVQRVELAEGERTGPLVLSLRTPLSLVALVRDSAGEPVYDATVSLEQRRTGEGMPGRIRAQRTDANGRAEFDAVPHSHVRVTVRATDHLDLTVPATLKPEGRPNELTLTMHRRAMLEGEVVDSEGEPLAGVEVRLRSLEPDAGPPRSSRTESDGRFAFQGLEPGPAALDVREVRFGPYPLRPDETVHAGTLEVPRKGTLEVRVLAGETEEAVTDARVVAHPLDEAFGETVVLHGGAPVVANSDESGVARLPLGAGDYALHVRGRGHAPHHVREAVHVFAGRTTRLDVRVRVGGRVAGTVRDQHRAPVQTPLRLIRKDDPRAVVYGSSDAAGHFVFAHVAPGTYRLRAGTAGEPSRFGARPREYFEVSEGETAQREVRLSVETATLEFVLEHAHGQNGILDEGATLGIARRTGLDGTGPTVRYEVEALATLADNRAHFEGLPVGKTLVALLRTSEHPVPVEFLLGELRPGRHARTLEIPGEHGHAGTLAGTVRCDESSTGVVGAHIHAWRIDTDGRPLVLRETTSAVDGSFHVRDVPPGRYRLAVTAPGKAAVLREHDLLPHGESQPLEITLGKAGHLVFQVHLEAAAPDSVVRATLHPEGNAYASRVRTARAGEWLLFSQLRVNETYRLRFESEHHRGHDATYVVRRPAAEVERIRLEAR